MNYTTLLTGQGKGVKPGLLEGVGSGLTGVSIGEYGVVIGSEELNLEWEFCKDIIQEVQVEDPPQAGSWLWSVSA